MLVASPNQNVSPSVAFKTWNKAILIVSAPGRGHKVLKLSNSKIFQTGFVQRKPHI